MQVRKIIKQREKRDIILQKLKEGKEEKEEDRKKRYLKEIKKKKKGILKIKIKLGKRKIK